MAFFPSVSIRSLYNLIVWIYRKWLIRFNVFCIWLNIYHIIRIHETKTKSTIDMKSIFNSIDIIEGLTAAYILFNCIQKLINKWQKFHGIIRSLVLKIQHEIFEEFPNRRHMNSLCMGHHTGLNSQSKLIKQGIGRTGEKNAIKPWRKGSLEQILLELEKWSQWNFYV